MTPGSLTAATLEALAAADDEAEAHAALRSIFAMAAAAPPPAAAEQQEKQH